ncbi:hypothetical protein MTO96_028128 [Rhipicephalus appendiculatus]
MVKSIVSDGDGPLHGLALAVWICPSASQVSPLQSSRTCESFRIHRTCRPDFPKLVDGHRVLNTALGPAFALVVILNALRMLFGFTICAAGCCIPASNTIALRALLACRALFVCLIHNDLGVGFARLRELVPPRKRLVHGLPSE